MGSGNEVLSTITQNIIITFDKIKHCNLNVFKSSHEYRVHQYVNDTNSQ